MNVIRTTAVELLTIPAIAYKQKLASGGCGLRILRLDQGEVGVFTINKRDGEAVPYGKVDINLFPDFAVDEALEMTNGLPYSSRGKICVSVFSDSKEEDEVTEEETNAIDMVGSDEYTAIIDRYSDETGKMNYQLMNKDFIQFAAKSSTVSKMVGERASEGDILLHVLKNRAGHLANKRESLSDDEVKALIETLEEIDTRGAFKELKAHIRRLLARR
ncbi:MAG: hypothetical protein FWE29_03820 [Defluviitaleaceae bacterium]|nr:hypothetical protein [Defluviitaleaceae bacterium]